MNNKAATGSVYDQINRSRDIGKVKNIQKKIGNRDEDTDIELSHKIKHLEDNINQLDYNEFDSK